jgi:hypothetical protein
MIQKFSSFILHQGKKKNIPLFFQINSKNEGFLLNFFITADSSIKKTKIKSIKEKETMLF